MAISLANHFKYARTVGHPPQSTSAVNTLLKVSSSVLLLLVAAKVFEIYHRSVSLTLDEARLMIDRPYAFILITDINTIQEQVIPNDGDVGYSDSAHKALCQVIERSLRALASADYEFECANFAAALSIPVVKFEQETYRNRIEMERLKEAKINRYIFEDAVAAFFVSALSDYIRHVKVDRKKWSLFGDRETNVSVTATRPLVLLNSDSFYMRFSRGLVTKQSDTFLNFIVVADSDETPPVVSETWNMKENLTYYIRRNVLHECKAMKLCQLLYRREVHDESNTKVARNILSKLRIARP